MSLKKQTEIEKLQDEISRLKAELELLRKSKDSVDAQNTILFANLSHEFRNPLNGIMGFAELLRTGDVSCEDVRTYTNVIEESGRVLLDIVTDVFDLSKIRSGQYKIYPESFDLNDMLFEMLMKFRDRAESAGLQLFVENMISEENIVSSSPEALGRVLSKLLDNAIKYTKSGWVKMSYEDKGNGMLLFKVEDTGIGIQEPTRSNLFNRFTELEVSKTRKVSGTGLDLTLCNGLVKLMGGEIWYENREQGGSIFSFSIINHQNET